MTIFKETFHQTLAAVTVNLNEFMVGLGYGWIAPILVRLQNSEGDFTPTAEQLSWIASLHEVGRVFGPLFSAYFLDNIGRKYTIAISSLLFFINWFFMVFARTVVLIYALRFIFGVIIGMSEVSSSIYLTENCSPKIRGILGSFISLSFYAGVFVEYILATYLSYMMVAIVNTFLGLIAVLTFFQLKETPYFLLLKGHYEAAETNLMWLKGHSMSKFEVAQELDKIKQNMQREQLKKTSMMRLFTAPENYKTMTIILITYLLIMATGYTSINSYLSTILQPSSTFTSNQFTILLGLIQFMAVCISPFIIERYNRRTLILISFLSMGLCHACTFFFFTIIRRHPTIAQHDYSSWLVFASITEYSVIFASIYPAIFVIRGELLPMSVKAIGGSLAIVVNSLTGFATARLFPVIMYYYGIEYNFLVYFIACVFGFIYVYIMLPETRGKSLIEIQKELERV